MTRNAVTAWHAIIEASCTIRRVRTSRSLSASTSPKAKLPNCSMSSGSVSVSADSGPGNGSSWGRRAASLIAMVCSFRSGGGGVGSGVLLVGDRFEPFGGVALGGLVEDRVVAHHVLRGAAVPVLFSGRGPDRLPGAQADGGAVAGGHQADPVGALQQLAVGVGVPVGAGPGREPEQADDQARGAVAVEDRVHVDIAGEVRRGGLDR